MVLCPKNSASNSIFFYIFNERNEGMGTHTLVATEEPPRAKLRCAAFSNE